MPSNSYERKKKQTCEPLPQTLVQATPSLPLDYCNSRLTSLFSTQQPEGTFSKTGQIASLLCFNSRSGSPLSDSPLLSLVCDPSPLAHSSPTRVAFLLVALLESHLPDSHMVPSLPSGLCLIIVLPRKPFLTPCILIK